MAKTTDNLQQAFAGESQANRKYLFFADKAEEEGQKQIARLFRAAAEAETVHARNHLRVLQGIKSTKDNLSAAIGGEHHEFTQMYPGFIKEAEGENQTGAKRSFDLANQVEKTHHGLFRGGPGQPESGQRPCRTSRSSSARSAGTPWREPPRTSAPSAERWPRCSRRSSRDL